MLYSVKFKLVGTWIKKERESECCGENKKQEIKGTIVQRRIYFTRFLESKILQWDEASYAEQMLDQVKRVMVNSARELCNSVGVR